MNILALKPGHDGSVTLITDGALRFCLEAEKDSHTRYGSIHPKTLLDAISQLDEVPDVIAIGGWYRGPWISDPTYLSGYFGCDRSCDVKDEINVFGRKVSVFSSTHERSHLLCALGLSPFEEGQFCYGLVWEGHLGAFYEIDESVRIRKVVDVLPGIGDKYLYFYNLAHQRDDIDFAAAGKLMALAAYSKRVEPCAEDMKLIDFVIDHAELMKTPLSAVSWSPLYRAGIMNDRFLNAAGVFSDRLFERFLTAAKAHVSREAPLLIAGGCGLNCDWNTLWLESGVFSDLFVPPCANDSGSGIGTAVDAQLHFTGSAKVDWSVYSGARFVKDIPCKPTGYRRYPAKPATIASLLAGGKILGWVEGRCEIGPRALGHRSILAEPFSCETRDRLNHIKQREQYRPIAPVCTLERVQEYFQWNGSSPYMLHFQQVKSRQLSAVTHVDGTARVQTLAKRDSPRLYETLEQFRDATGFAVLCNTSLNERERGFINRLSDLANFARNRSLDGFVVEEDLYLPT